MPRLKRASCMPAAAISAAAAPAVVLDAGRADDDDDDGGSGGGDGGGGVRRQRFGLLLLRSVSSRVATPVAVRDCLPTIAGTAAPGRLLEQPGTRACWFVAVLPLAAAAVVVVVAGAPWDRCLSACRAVIIL